ncbi:MAG: hypothetical protein ACI4VE_02970 [Clostridia bacterium]
MKKGIYILVICIVCLIAIIIYCSVKSDDKKTRNITIDNMQCKADEVVSIEMKEETEGGYIYYKTEEKQLIEEIVNALNKIEVKEKTNLMFSDNTKTYILTLYDGTTLKYSFQANYYHEDNINYEIDNYEDLMKIKIPAEIVNN